MRRWYFWVLAPLCLGAALLFPLLLFAGESSPSGQLIVFVCALSTWLVLATLGLANPTRFRWALIVDAAALGVLVVYAILTDKSPPPPPMLPAVRRFREIVGGAFAGLGLLVALLDTIGASLWARGPRHHNYSQIVIAPPILYLTGGFVVAPAHPGWRVAVVGLLLVVGTLAVQSIVPRLAEAWARGRGESPRSAHDSPGTRF